MKRLWRVVILAVPALVLAAVGWTTVQFNFYSPRDPKIAPDRAAVDYFLDSFEASRDAFRKKAETLKGTYRDASLTSIPVVGKIDRDLTVDVLYIPAQKAKKRLLVMSSGVHGVEGFTGSAVQRMFLDEFVTPHLLENTGVLIIHTLNPYGFKHVRRFTEDNVDLNRNCDTDPRLFTTRNTNYSSLVDFINPQSTVATRSAGNIFFHIKAAAQIMQTSTKVLRQAVMQGQYEFPKGLFFGGSDFEPQIRALVPLIKPILNDYPIVMNIDLHTGHGQRGVLHLFPNPMKEGPARSMIEKIFAGSHVDWGDSADFYTVTGEFSTFLGKLMTSGTYLPMTFEYGTFDSQTTMGSIKSLHIAILENQGTQYGYASAGDEIRVKANFRELFYPSSPAWRTKVIHDSRVLLKTSLTNFEKL